MKENLQSGTSDNNLLIRIQPDGVTYAITDENEQVILQQMVSVSAQKLKDIQFLEHFFDQPEFRVLSENVSIIFENSNYQLIPNELFREEDVNTLYELEFGKADSTSLIFNLLPQWGAHLIYRVEEPLIAFLEKKYPEAEMEHHIFSLLKKKVARNGTAVYAYVRKETVDIIVVKDSVLALANSFQTKTNEDICYFVLNVYEQLELDTETVPLKLMAEGAVNEILVQLIEQYIVNFTGV